MPVALTVLYQVLGAPAALQAVSGWIGVPLLVFSRYGGLAVLLEDGAQRTVLPLGRRGRARTSLEGDLNPRFSRPGRSPASAASCERQQADYERRIAARTAAGRITRAWPGRQG